MDDILSGGHSIDEAQEKQSEITQALYSASFPFKKITSYSSILISQVAESGGWFFISHFCRSPHHQATYAPSLPDCLTR